MKKTVVLLILTLTLGSAITGCSLNRKAGKLSETQTEKISENSKKQTGKKDDKKTAFAEKEKTPVQKADKNDQTASQNTAPTEIPEQGWDSIVLYDRNLDGVTVNRGSDGNWYDDNGISYGNIDEIEDESLPIYDENGKDYYWNASYAEKAALAEQDFPIEQMEPWTSIIVYRKDLSNVRINRGEDGIWYDDDGVSYGDFSQPGGSSEEDYSNYDSNGEAYYWNELDARKAAMEESGEISDPYDLYSWDGGTNSYIPYQQAGSDGSPIGRGNGWYYFDAEEGEYLPW